MRRDPLACALGTRDHQVIAKRKSLLEEFTSLKRAITALQRDIDKFDPKVHSALRGAKLIALHSDKVARLQVVAARIAEGHTFQR